MKGTNQIGSMNIRGKDPGIIFLTITLPLNQDLLQMQYDGVAVMKMFDKAKVNVNLLIFLLNRKFYGK
ncbi:unnamed protein product [Ranitomeya imitator]|uniref:Uncharacterized protein n=1 Tax=Ranitomeya imitator TaxID=111125 RepID=A0ABN9L2E8_9NEOB|nr:unnamed protein product [Ranitomeya imitator]